MKSNRGMRTLGAAFKYVSIVVLFAFLLFPVYWMAVTSLKTNVESYRIVPSLWPESMSLEGYRTLFQDGKFLLYYQNNLIVSALAALLICVISIMAGYALSRFHFRWNVLLLATFSFSQMMPVISRLISLYGILRRLGMTDSHLGLVLAISATQVPSSPSVKRYEQKQTQNKNYKKTARHPDPNQGPDSRYLQLSDDVGRLPARHYAGAVAEPVDAVPGIETDVYGRGQRLAADQFRFHFRRAAHDFRVLLLSEVYGERPGGRSGKRIKRKRHF